MQVRNDKNLHTSVLLQELVESLQISESKKNIIVDCTLGLAGHASVVLGKLRAGDMLIGFDADKRNLCLAEKKLGEVETQANYILVHSNFRHIKEELLARDIHTCTAIYYDLGVSSLHFDEAERGFSLRLDGPLDMRFDTRQKTKASDILNFAQKDEIYNILKNYGEEPYARKIAETIITQRKIKKFETTYDLNTFLETYINSHIKTKMRVFQALRIAVNEELISLEESLENSLTLLETNGILSAISFHSLEDRCVKHFFKKYAKNEDWDEHERQYIHKKQLKILTKKPITPSQDEWRENRRSRSAKLRIAQKL